MNSKGKTKFLTMPLACVGLAIVFGIFCPPLLQGQVNPPKFEIDPYWPKPFPDNWVTGRIGGICIDKNDHVFLFTRRDLLMNDKEAGTASPVMMEVDPEGNVVNSWGDPEAVPVTAHGCAVDYENNVWLTGDADGMIQKYSHDGKLLLQIGTKGVVDSSDGLPKGAPMNSSHVKVNGATQVQVDPGNGDIYVADGVGNRRVVVFDRNGKFLRQWGRQGTKEEVAAGVGGVFMTLVHSLTLANDGLLYVADRYGNRIEVFDKLGNFKRNIFVRNEGKPLPDPSGTVLWVAFSPDAAQKFMYVADEYYDQIDIFDHATDRYLGSFGRVGHQVGNMEHPHQLVVDSKGNIFVCEEEWGRRADKWKLVGN